MAAQRKTYSRKFIEGAIEYYNAAPGPSHDEKVDQVSRQLKNLDHNLIERWLVNADEFLGPPLPDNLRERLDYLIDKVSKEIDVAIANSSLRDLTVSFGILVDKKRLLNEQSTQNVDQHFSFTRSGLSTIPVHLAPEPAIDVGETQEIQRHQLRETVGEDSPGG